ncbi:MAG: hypothetical protein V8T66_05800 [Phocaeicola sp.]|uniref:hypothetical protein n=1 Tax=Phocaeicola TaxID=909656 RepID=UPI00242CE9BE|nr:hypothetical protein [Phocaeicola coprocola]MBS4814822.1 hypothetical protein [Bacteroides sp.]
MAETGKPIVKTYYDALKREVRTATTRFDGKELKTDKVYDTKTGQNYLNTMLCRD